MNYFFTICRSCHFYYRSCHYFYFFALFCAIFVLKIYCSTSLPTQTMNRTYLLLSSLVVGIIVLFVPMTNLRAQQPDWAKVHSVTMSSIESLYNLNFEEAEARANEVIKLAPQDPRGYFFRAMTYYYRFYYCRISDVPKQETDAEFQKFMGYSQQTISLCERFLAQNPNDSKTLFYMGGLYGYRGLAIGNNGKTSEYLTAARDAKKGVDLLKQSLAIDPNNADAQMGLGLFNYIISQTPSFAQSIIKLAGLSGNKNEGLKQLEYAAANGVYARAEAQTWLAKIYSVGVIFTDGEGLFDRAERHYASFLALYPGNTLIRYLYGNMLADDMRRASDAISQFRAAADDKGKRVERLAAICQLELGNVYLSLTNFTNAISAFQSAVAMRPDWLSLNYGIGLCLELQGNRASALPYYAKAKGNKEAEKLITTPLSEKESQLFKCRWAFQSGDDTKAIALIGDCLKRSDLSREERARMHYFGGRALASKGDTKLAEGYYAQALALLTEEHELKAPLYYYLGLVQAKNGKKPDAIGSLEQALSLKNYPNEPILRKSIERDLYRLKRS